MAMALVCWKCDRELDGVILPIGRREACPRCGADLHVCRMCNFYDTAVSKDCREPVADEVAEKERANFCDYFRPFAAAAKDSGSSEADAARAKLASLFGGPEPETTALADEAARLREEFSSEADQSCRRLERLFGTKDGAGN